MYENSKPPFEPTPFEVEVKIKLKGTFLTDDPEQLWIRLDNSVIDEAKSEIRSKLMERIETDLPIEIEKFGFGASFIAVPTGASFNEKINFTGS